MKSKKIILSFLIIMGIFMLTLAAYFLGKQSGQVRNLPNSDINSEILSSGNQRAVTQAPNNPPRATTAQDRETPTPSLKTVILNSERFLDGFYSSNGTGNYQIELRVGRNPNLVSRAFVSFDLSELPQNAKVKDAILRIYQVKITGKPFEKNNQIKIDHLTYGETLDPNDYAHAALSQNFATLESNLRVGWKEVDVSSKVRNDLDNARVRSQFRIHMQTETTGGDAAGDFVFFESRENSLGTDNIPQLVVTYE